MVNKLYQKFSATEDYSGYDHIVIGSGIGGLTAAIWLARAGYKVIIFEKHYIPGGFAQHFKRKGGYIWDVGIHYVGNMAQNHGLRMMMNFITSSAVDWNSMGDIYDVINIEGDTYEIPAGESKWVDQMHCYFPEDTTAIDQYLQLIKKSNSWANGHFIQKSFHPVLRFFTKWFLDKKFYELSDKTTLEVLRGITTNKRLIAVLTGQCGNYGLPPNKSSFAAHALIVGHFMEGGYYPYGGSRYLVEACMSTFHKLGGQIVVGAEAEELKVVKNKTKGVVINGVDIACKSVISNIGYANTFKKLIPLAHRPTLNKHSTTINPSVGHMCLYIGLDLSDHDLNLPKHNIWNYANEDFSGTIEQAELSSIAQQFSYISFPSAKDPNWSAEHGDTATIQAMSYGNFDWFSEYKDQPWLNREEAYKAMKDQFKTTMLEELYRLLPQIKGHVAYSEVSTPLSTSYFTSHAKGEIYGLEHTPNRFRLNLRPETKIKGLRMVGQDVTVVGVAGALMSGLLCAITILHFETWKVIRLFKKTNPS
ncbi:MAG: NAD(P)/FAD-dependent oxidoreductase [Reichenbachiella sp.]